ncbi:hypothetical protein AC578_453 [Pseudocercospora eumusae]|uniref:Uncharacterized protein n=1 Tax=Pseudocercospora eumusae TaxID=321146 RepID=A0A139HY81_9PEZI|nr:hypothetical protein AC578_453 [Pseudocercospora eumusae]
MHAGKKYFGEDISRGSAIDHKQPRAQATQRRSLASAACQLFPGPATSPTFLATSNLSSSTFALETQQAHTSHKNFHSFTFCHVKGTTNSAHACIAEKRKKKRPPTSNHATSSKYHSIYQIKRLIDCHEDLDCQAPSQATMLTIM